IVLMVISIGTLQAQESTEGRKNAMKNQHEQLISDLKMSDEQSAEWTAIHKEYRPKIKAVKTDESLSKEEKSAKAKALKAEMDEKLNAVLSAEQAAKWAAMKEEKKGQRKEDNKAQRHEKIAQELALTEKQSAAWMEIHEKYDAQKAAVKADSSLSEEARKKKMMSIRKDQRKAIEAILSPEQLAKLKAMKEE
ncbi:MAG: hypothetical protein NWS86_06320, partial [Flavobacteriales bacterium]|nr:hypothetical protein [Flavobacteriales bacterium]